MPAFHAMDNNDMDEEKDEFYLQKKQWLELQRLLYCMERPWKDGKENHHKNWQALLLRAEHCHNLWQRLMEVDPQAQQLSQRVDQACRKAQEQAESIRQQQSLVDDWIDRIFFGDHQHPPPQQQQQQQQQQHKHSSSSLSPPPEPYEEYDDDDEEEKDLYDGLDEEEALNPDSFGNDTKKKKEHNHHSQSLQDFQKIQREQMEEAIALMASQMKDATQGIQSQLQKQTAQTLTELESVAEQNVHDVTAVTQNVQQHNQRQRKRNWGTWTLLFTVIGVFLLSLVTIFTIPKRPNTCLIFCKGDSSSSLAGWIGQPVRVLILKPVYWLWYDCFGNKQESPKETWDHLYQEGEAERREKERLDQLLQSLKTETNKKPTKTVDWRKAMEEENDNDGDNEYHDEEEEDDDDGDDNGDDGEEEDDDDDIEEEEDENDVFGDRESILQKSAATKHDPLGHDTPATKQSLPPVKERHPDKIPKKTEPPDNSNAGNDKHNTHSKLRIDERRMETVPMDAKKPHDDKPDTNTALLEKSGSKKSHHQKEPDLNQEKPEAANLYERKSNTETAHIEKRGTETTNTTKPESNEDDKKKPEETKTGLDEEHVTEATQRDAVLNETTHETRPDKKEQYDRKPIEKDTTTDLNPSNNDKTRETSRDDRHEEGVPSSDEDTLANMASQEETQVKGLPLESEKPADINADKKKATARSNDDNKDRQPIQETAQGKEEEAPLEESPSDSLGEKVKDGGTKLQQILPNGDVVEDAPKVPETVQDVNMAALLASLNQAAQKTKEEDLVALESAAAASQRKSSAGVFDDMDGIPVDTAKAREGAAKNHISPRDIRSAADTGDVEKLKHCLELEADFVDRQDRNKWTALHLAARRGHTDIVRVLHEHGASLTIENNRGNTPLKEGILHLGEDHDAVKLLRQLSGEYMEDKDQTDDEMMKRKWEKWQAKQNAIRLALETLENEGDLKSYVKMGRENLEKMKPKTTKSIGWEEDIADDFQQYLQVGRTRLEAILATEGFRSEL